MWSKNLTWSIPTDQYSIKWIDIYLYMIFGIIILYEVDQVIKIENVDSQFYVPAAVYQDTTCNNYMYLSPWVDHHPFFIKTKHGSRLENFTIWSNQICVRSLFPFLLVPSWLWSYGSWNYQLPVQPVPITLKLWVRTPFMAKFVSDLWQVSGFLCVLQFPLPIKLTTTI